MLIELLLATEQGSLVLVSNLTVPVMAIIHRQTDNGRIRFRTGSGYADAMAITNDRRIGIRRRVHLRFMSTVVHGTNLTVDNQAYIDRVGIGWTSNWHQNLSIRKV